MKFRDIISSKPNLQYVFVGGKGGVGKTVIASGIAYYYAEKLGKRTLLSSTNPVHSLSSIFKQDIWKKGIQKIEGTERLFAIEIDIADLVKKYRQEIREKILYFLKYADIPVNPEPFIDVATTNPAFEETAMFESMLDLMLKREFDVYVFDTAPVAHTYRLLGMSSIYSLWVDRMLESRKEALSLREKLSFRKEKVRKEIEEDVLVKTHLEMKKRIDEGRRILTDPNRTLFFFVTLPLALPIAVVERFIKWVKSFDIPVGGVIVNEVIPKDKFDLERASPYLINKLKEQDYYMRMIHDKLGDLVISYVPLYDTEVVGVEMIAKVADDLELFMPS